MNRHAIAPKIFIYLDCTGIESLYSQTVDRLEIEMIDSNELTKGAKANLKIGLGKILSALGLIDVNTDAELSLSKKVLRESKTSLAVEHKLFALLKYLEQLNDNDYFTDLHAAAKQCFETHKPVFINIYKEFDLPQFYPGGGSVKDVNDTKYVEFRIGKPAPGEYGSYDYLDNYFKSYISSNKRYFMSASIEKFPRAYGKMAATGHDAVMFRASEGKNFPLNVFGDLKSLREDLLQIKPYAVWL